MKFALVRTEPSEPYLKSGDRISYAVSSGFATLVYEGEVIKVGNRKSCVQFDGTLSHTPIWVENNYLKVLRGFRP